MSEKMKLTFGMFFQNAFAAQLCHKLEGFFRESEGFFQGSKRLLLKSANPNPKVSAPKVSATRYSITYGSSRAVFVSSGAVYVTAKQHSNGNGNSYLGVWLLPVL